jgi:hypothetical protein
MPQPLAHPQFYNNHSAVTVYMQAHWITDADNFGRVVTGDDTLPNSSGAVAAPLDCTYKEGGCTHGEWRMENAAGAHYLDSNWRCSLGAVVDRLPDTWKKTQRGMRTRKWPQ